MKNRLISATIAIVIAGLFLWLGLWLWNIPFNFGSVGSFLYYSVFVIGGPITIVIAGFAIERDEGFVWIGAPAGLLVVVMIIGWLSSGALFNARGYATQLAVPEAKQFAEDDIPAFDPAQIPWVDQEYAKVLGDKPLGSLGAIGSSVEIGEYVQQDVGGKLYFVAPILHSGFFKYNANPGGTPGYIMVSMTDDDDVQLIDDYSIRVQPHGHAAWGDKLERIVQGIAPGALRHEAKFEIDDEFHPYWVVPICEKRIGLWGGTDITSVVIVDATNGQNAKWYPLDAVPAWVDRIYPTSLIEEQLSNWGLYSGGYWNTWFGKTGLLQSDEGNAVVYSNGDCYVFDSLTSRGGSDESTVGFVLVNLRTKETRRFNLAGATEYAAQISAIGDERVKAQNYAATFPLPTVIEGQTTYFMTLVDPSSHIVKSYAFVHMSKHQIVGIGNTIRAAEMDYRTKLRTSGQTSIYTPSANLIEITGEIVRWGAYNQDGNTYYQFIVSGHEDQIFITDLSSPEATITKEGDRVALRVMKTDNSNWTVFSFDNLEFTQQMSEIEQTVTEAEMEQRLQEVQENPSIMDDSKFQEFWDSLTPEQQAEFLEQTSSKEE